MLWDTVITGRVSDRGTPAGRWGEQQQGAVHTVTPLAEPTSLLKNKTSEIILRNA